jgi:signal transduction histidine kinase
LSARVDFGHESDNKKGLRRTPKSGKTLAMNDGQQIHQILDSCSVPLFVVDISGFILWRNSEAKSLSLAPNSAAIFGDQILRKLPQSTFEHSYIVQQPVGLPAILGRHLTITDISGADPNDARFLLRLSTVTPQSLDIEGREWALASAAHELKNPIGALFSYADTLLETELAAQLPAKHREIIGAMRKLAFRSIELIRNYQTLATIDRSSSAASLARSDLNATIHIALDALWNEAQDKSRLSLQLAEARLMVAIKQGLLERALVNLLNNALQYSRPLSRIEVRTWREGQSAWFSVFNEGTPIPESEHTTIFQRATRGTTALKTPGSGLGLYIAKKIVETCGGALSLETNQKGNLFCARFPLSSN